ncbi:MAG: mechanosensitive ion channel family protein [Bacteroidota bacterium]|nr:mechanosensitive ion channel family protein [Bacteroidota bacterium]
MFEVREAVSLIENKLAAWLEHLVRMLPNIALATFMVIVFWLIAKALRKISNKLFVRVFESGTLQRLMVSLIYGTTILIGVFAALSVLHLDKTVTSLLAGAGILGLALGFAFQDIASNFIAGIIIATNRPIRVGELIQTKDQVGVVQRIDLRTTEIRSLQGIQVIIPNKEIFQTVLMNYTRNGIRRVDLVVRISFTSDLSIVQQITMEAVRSVPDVLLEQEIDLFYLSFEDDAIELEVRFWIQALGNKHYQRMRSNAIMAIKSAFDRAGIVIPFPIRTLEFAGKDAIPDAGLRIPLR